MTVVKYCEGCRFEGRSMGAHPCSVCAFGSRFEAATITKDNIVDTQVRRCATCEYENLPGHKAPCDTCGCGVDYKNWTPVTEKKTCNNCRFCDVRYIDDPCLHCENEDEWLPKVKDGKTAKVIMDVASMYPSISIDYNRADAMSTMDLFNHIMQMKKERPMKPYITNVIFNDPATIVFWSDHTKTVVKCQDGDIFDAEKGLAMAISKKYFGNRGHYCEEFKKWLPEEQQTDDLGKIAMKMTRTQVFPTEIVKEIVAGIRFGSEKE